ncbi:MAG: hypothetical protein LBT86_09935 [Deltaproteobacteria bacterium]|nr:hypothetical protein [Deltaproteobacteria bacterium]
MRIIRPNSGLGTRRWKTKDIGPRVRQLAPRKGLSAAEVWEKLNYAATLYHIKKEAAEAYRHILVDE